jgi:trehalose-phosphatase
LEREGRDKLGAFWSRLKKTGKGILMMDYDGTLAPIEAHPKKGLPFPGVRERVRRITRSPTCRLVIVSGRWTTDLVELLDLDPVPEIWGCHGMERLHPDGLLETGDLHEQEILGLVEADQWAISEGLKEMSEKKPGCVALHYESDETLEPEFKEMAKTTWERIARNRGLDLHEFHGGIELRPPGHDKGNVVDTLLSESGDNPTAVFLGDGMSDEDAFRAIKGRGLGILVSEQWRPTEAQAWLKPPGQLLDFLDTWSEICGGDN